MTFDSPKFPVDSSMLARKSSSQQSNPRSQRYSSRLVSIVSTAKIWLARGLKEAPFATTTARSEPIGVAGNEPGEAEAVLAAAGIEVRDTPQGVEWEVRR